MGECPQKDKIKWLIQLAKSVIYFQEKIELGLYECTESRCLKLEEGQIFPKIGFEEKY